MEQLKCHQDMTKFQHHHHYNVLTLLQVRAICNWTYLQKGDDIIMMVMLKFCQILVIFKLLYPANLENNILKNCLT